MCIIHKRNDKILHVSETLKYLGNKVELLYWDEYIHVCSYWNKKLNKMGLKKGEEKYLAKWKQNFRKLIEDFSPAQVLFVDYAVGFLDEEDLKMAKSHSTLTLWLVDSIRRMGGVEKYYFFMDIIWAFEEDDVSVLRQKFGFEAKYIGVGYNSDYRPRKNLGSKNIDVCFVGAPYTDRLNILEEVSSKCTCNISIYGPFYEEKYFWKKYQFKLKYPKIYAYLHNGFYTSKEIADIYTHSKICLNIHLREHKGIGPRTYEIMATESFELMDEREEYGPVIQPGRNVAIYHDVEDLIKKIEYYLKAEDERTKIAPNGYCAVKGSMSLDRTLKTILNI